MKHVARLVGSAERLGLPQPDPDALRALADAVLDAAGAPDAVLRLYWTPGAAGGGPSAIALVSAIPEWIEPARARGQRLVSLAFPRRSAPWLLPGTKSVSYATHAAAEGMISTSALAVIRSEKQIDQNTPSPTEIATDVA